MKKIFNQKTLIVVALLLAVGCRLSLVAMRANDDLFTQLRWGQEAYSRGTLKEFYDWKIWGGGSPNHPPLIIWLYSMVYTLHSKIMWLLSSLGTFIALHRLAPTKFYWLYNFNIWFGTQKYGTLAILAGQVFLLKLIMVLADLAIAGTIYFLCKSTKKDWKLPVLTYILLPFSWYLSSSWGQSDQLSFVFFIISLILISSKRLSLFSPLFYAIAANFKPNCLLLLPVYLLGWFYQKNSWKNLVSGGIIAIVFSIWTVSWFTDKNVLQYTFSVLPTKLNTSDGFINYNAFNFWYIFYPFNGRSFLDPVLDSTKFIFLSAKTWGWIMTLVTTLLSFKVFRDKKSEDIFGAVFVSGFGSWLFMTGMHERYGFLGIAPLLFLVIYQKKYWKYFLTLSMIYTFNLVIVYLPWGDSEQIGRFLETVNYLPTRILSVINILIYARVCFLLTKSQFKSDRITCLRSTEYEKK